MSEEIENAKKILAKYRERLGLNLDKLPQGPGSRLDADTVDGLHLQQIIAKAQRTFPQRSGGFVLPHFSTDPALASLGAGNLGYLWLNVSNPAAARYKFYDGTSIQTLPSAATAGAHGTATITIGNTTKVVAHGLGDTPTDVQLTPKQDVGSRRFWWDSEDATNFTINISSPDLTNNLVFSYSAY